MDVARNSDTVIPIRDKVRVAGFDANVPRVPDRKIRQRPHFRRRRFALPVKTLRSARVGPLGARPLTDPSGVGSLPRPKVPQPPASDRTPRQESPIRRRRIADWAKIDQSAPVGSVNSPEDPDPTAS